MTPAATDAPRLVLASASPARLRLLRGAGFDPEVVVSGVDEEAAGAGATDTTSLVMLLAECKARAVADHLADARPDAGEHDSEAAIVVGCDSLLDLDGEPVGKPKSADEAFARWRSMRGRTGVLRTGHCIIDVAAGRAASGVASTTVHFANPTDAQVKRYIATGEPLAVAGAFTIDGRGGIFIQSISGDHGNVIGLSLPLFRELLSELGIEATRLWC